MANRMGSIWRWGGRVSRGTYAAFGICGVAIKHNMDRLLALSYGLPWGVWSYLDPLNRAAHFSPLTNSEKHFLLVLLLTALPFVWVGIMLTVKRLRDAGQPLWLTLLFFAPVVNLIFFALLCVTPSSGDGVSTDGRTARPKAANTYWPKSREGSATVAATIAGLVGIGMTWVALRFVGVYGLTLFISLPFVMGYLSVLIYSRTQRVGFSDVLRLVTFSLLVAGVGITAIAVEGVICILMAAPLAWVIAFFGGAAAQAIHGRQDSPQVTPSMYAAVLVTLPLLLGVEHASPPPVPRFRVQTSIEIAAPPDMVWKRVVAFPPLPEAKEWPFNFGIAYPIEAQLRGEGLAADRECRFSTGSFKEPILAWEPGRHFAFAVAQEPLLMKETSPYKEIHVRHLEDHDFQPERADFVLVALANGGTRLEGTTTYTNKMWPGMYWRLWTDAIIHRIHYRVFSHVKELAEADATMGR